MLFTLFIIVRTKIIGHYSLLGIQTPTYSWGKDKRRRRNGTEDWIKRGAEEGISVLL